VSLTASVCLQLSEWISFLLVAVPPRSRRAFVGLLIGCMLSPEGWVTRAIGAFCRDAHWTTYYKLIEQVHVSVANLSIRLLKLVQSVVSAEVANLIIDDTLMPRTSEIGPGISMSALTVPIRSWLVEESGLRGKLWLARQAIDSVRGHVKDARLLIDAWFVR
jgi:hypothetical protein